MNKILITGGAGLIGSNLCEYLLNQSNNNEIICVDNFNTGTLNNIKHLQDNINFRCYEYDITRPLPDIKINQIYNLASPTGAGHFKLRPIETIKANVNGTINVLNIAKKLNIPIVHTSTVRTLENNTTYNDNACYAESKRCSETICYEYQKQGVNVKVVRLFNVYGENMRIDDSRVIPTFIRNAIKNETITVLGDGNQKDSFCYVDDIVIGLTKLMNIELKQPINMGSNEFISIKDLAELIIKITNSKSLIEYKQSDDIKDRLNINIDNNLIDWKPMINLEDGIKKII